MKTIGFTLFITTFFFTTTVHAQAPYNRALGLKFPGGLSITYKKFVADTRNVEAQLTAWHKGFRVAGLYEFNFYTFDNVPELSWFVGPGAHIGFWKSTYKETYNSQVDVGVDGIIGLDYKIKNAPINVSADWEPAVTLVGSAGFTPAFGGVAIRYTF
jgi:hypothetical protein